MAGLRYQTDRSSSNSTSRPGAHNRPRQFPALTAELHALEARGLALLAETNAARRAVLTAQRTHQSARPGDQPPWQGPYTERVLTADVGLCLRGISETKQALTLTTTALQCCEPRHVRGRSLAQTNIALIHLLDRDLEQAAAYGRDALRTAADVSSTITLERLRTLQRQARPQRTSSPHLRELDERITDHLTRSIRRD